MDPIKFSGCVLARLYGRGVRDMWAILVTPVNPNFGLVFAKPADAWLQIGQLNLIHCNAAPEEEAGLAERSRLARIPGPFFVFTDGECYYNLTPDDDYLRRALNLE